MPVQELNTYHNVVQRAAGEESITTKDEGGGGGARKDNKVVCLFTDFIRGRGGPGHHFFSVLI